MDEEEDEESNSSRSHDLDLDLDLDELFLDVINNSDELDLEDSENFWTGDTALSWADHENSLRGNDAHTPENYAASSRLRQPTHALECGSGAAFTAVTGQRLPTLKPMTPNLADVSSGAAVSERNIPQEVVWHQTADAVHVRVVFSTLRDIQPGALRLKQDEGSIQLSFTEMGKQIS